MPGPGSSDTLMHRNFSEIVSDVRFEVSLRISNKTIIGLQIAERSELWPKLISHFGLPDFDERANGFESKLWMENFRANKFK